jgi:hypothetical protein
VKIFENENVIPFFFFYSGTPFKIVWIQGFKKTKQNKPQNIDLLNAHLKTEQFIGRKILCHFQHIFLLALFSSSE